MNILIAGTGYVGLVSGACLAELGHHVICSDRDDDKINRLEQGEIPIYEPGLGELTSRVRKVGRLRFVHDGTAYAHTADALIIAVGTPPLADGSADLSSLHTVIETMAPRLKDGAIIVNKSTVPVGTAHRVRGWIDGISAERPADFCPQLAVISNPEFLREGAAIEDFLGPDRIVLGSDDGKGLEVARAIYAPLAARGVPIIETNFASAELMKYASNAYLATRLSFVNEMSDLCEQLGADIRVVAPGMGMDHRIGPNFLRPGPGYGGSCFPKDTRALLRTAHEAGCPLDVITAGVKVNQMRKVGLIERITHHWGTLSGLNIAVLGLTFKSDTDDLRESPSLQLIPDLLESNAHIRAFDPQGARNASQVLDCSSNVHFSIMATIMQALQGADGAIILTEWPEFASIAARDFKNAMRNPRIIDFRNLLDPVLLQQAGVDYHGIGYLSQEAAIVSSHS
ncbi:MAG: UDP-glucose/GDP-mannose dehydrogenase family protein [Pseudomonadota bacterium]